ncbi:hypothetical protein LCGC14_0459380 [marine sediment metagenome]|uniref:DHHA1 domain-containing protein n=1 Tax=marine sediment metagenome TaxID=412755 RepID=A0A0F9SKV6_9ZZZZ
MNLSNIERVIVHGNCHDGMASAILIYDALGIEPEFMMHSSNEYLEMEATEGMLFCDIAPSKDRYQEFIEAGAIVLDHHRGTKFIVEAFGDNGVFADEDDDPGISGASLAFREVWEWEPEGPLSYNNIYPLMNDLQRLAGIRDTWQTHEPDWHESGEQATALTFYSWKHWKSKLDKGDYDFSKELAVGKMIYDSRMAKVDKFAKEAFKFEDAGYKIAVFNDPDRYTSDVAEALVQEGFNVIAGFHYAKKHPDDENPLMCFSVRTDGSIDASDLAGTIPGGGGHTKSAGFAEVIDLKEINAFAVFRDIFDDYIKYHR